MDRSGPVPAAVRAAGYRSEEEEDEEEDGSSVEEDDDEEYEEVEGNATSGSASGAAPPITASGAPAASGEEDVPAYSGAGKSSGVEIGSNGYAVEKKGESGLGAGEPSQDAAHKAAGKEKASEEATA
jgi:hypothetical protein